MSKKRPELHISLALILLATLCFIVLNEPIRRIQGEDFLTLATTLIFLCIPLAFLVRWILRLIDKFRMPHLPKTDARDLNYLESLVASGGDELDMIGTSLLRMHFSGLIEIAGDEVFLKDGAKEGKTELESCILTNLQQHDGPLPLTVANILSLKKSSEIADRALKAITHSLYTRDILHFPRRTSLYLATLWTMLFSLNVTKLILAAINHKNADDLQVMTIFLFFALFFAWLTYVVSTKTKNASPGTMISMVDYTPDTERSTIRMYAQDARQQRSEYLELVREEDKPALSSVSRAVAYRREMLRIQREQAMKELSENSGSGCSGCSSCSSCGGCGGCGGCGD